MKKYLYADESGNMDFRCHHKHPGATKYFALGTLEIEGEDKMEALRGDLTKLRYEVARHRPAFEGYFHASEEKQPVRDAVFEVLQGHDFKVDVTLIEKSKSMPHVRDTDQRFYKHAWYYHFKHFSNSYFKPDDELLVAPASLGTRKTRAGFRTVVEEVVNQCCKTEISPVVTFWDSKTDVLLQAADYALWAVMREREQGDKRSRVLIDDKINSVFDLFAWGRTHYYGPNAIPALATA